MQNWILALLTVFHVLAGVFWAGSAFVLARTRAAFADILAWPQIVAAMFAVLTGGWLWSSLHGAAFGPMEKVLACGASCAVLALLIQVSALPVVRRLSQSTDASRDAERAALMRRYGPAAGLLAIAVACMAAARYA